MPVREVSGNLISRALEEDFDVIAHCCNCWNKQKSGIAVQMVKNFQTDQFDLEHEELEGDYDKLGRIDWKMRKISDTVNLSVVNMYGQYHWQEVSPYGIPLDYDALRLCFRKLNKCFKNETIGIPGLIGCGLAKGEPHIVKQIIQEECKNTNIIIVYLKAPF